MLEVFKPATQRQVETTNGDGKADPVRPLRLLPNCVFEFLKTLLSWEAKLPHERVAQKIKTTFSDVNDVGLVGMQRQFGLSRPRLHHFQGPLCVVTRSTQNHESSSPGESHPQALTESDVNLSAHPALIVQSQDEFRSAKVRTSWVLGGLLCPASEQLVGSGERNV